eukprot:CAMPEP_0177638802 /NCGR_PEP_ID=MMETSP0447-20121125/5686_1 /TAXON_ID=0 /ORGANISM="Stygamoeba regulata, Strain BSH-02190019" /LENGTH=57 /DNA_ID=CAMNT_0019140795 /DNA_START=172 /DNA_END=345 /DNA_ORIENTATION=-
MEEWAERRQANHEDKADQQCSGVGEALPPNEDDHRWDSGPLHGSAIVDRSFDRSIVA